MNINKLKVLVIGGGGREHALAWKIAQSPRVEKIFCAPGNAGTFQTEKCANVSIKADDINALVRFAKEAKIDLAVVGPEEPLTNGIVDAFEKKGLRAFGPSKKAAILEGSKDFSKKLMVKYGIPTADFKTFTSPYAALSYLKKVGVPIVVKANGLAAGKGVMVCKTMEEAEDAIRLIMMDKVFGEAGNKVILEEFLVGEEASFLAFSDGKTVTPMPTSQDHKPISDDDQGPNTGGMGSYSPAPVIDQSLFLEVMNRVMIPTVRAMAKEGRPYKGVLYAGLMIDQGKINVLEYNVRFGDPEVQPLLMRMKSDIIPILMACTRGKKPLKEVHLEFLQQSHIEYDVRPAVCVVMAEKGYPGNYQKGHVISGLEKVKKMKDVVAFHAGTALEGNEVVTNGGRVLGVTALGEDIPQAIRKAYQAVKKIQWPEAYYRTDIGRKAIGRSKK